MALSPNLEHIDSLLDPWKSCLGGDFAGYRNHVVRLASFCLLLRHCSAEERQKIEIAACFHDIGLWTDNTLDYLGPSLPPAEAYLEGLGKPEWAAEMGQMIVDHHRIRPIKQSISPLVEVFRQGDLVDFSLGAVTFGLPKSAITSVKSAYPNAGFHKMLARRAGAWFVRHPLHPAPMMKW